MNKYLAIALGGALGSLARFGVGSLVTARFSGIGFWVGTFAVNMSACVLLGFSLALLERWTHVAADWRYFLPVGFVGAYSTFSTFEWELFSGLREGAFALCAIYLAASVLVGLACIWAGVQAAEWL